MCAVWLSNSFDGIRGGFRAFKTEEVSGENKESIVRDSGREREGRILLARGQFFLPEGKL